MSTGSAASTCLELEFLKNAHSLEQSSRFVRSIKFGISKQGFSEVTNPVSWRGIDFGTAPLSQVGFEKDEPVPNFWGISV